MSTLSSSMPAVTIRSRAASGRPARVWRKWMRRSDRTCRMQLRRPGSPATERTATGFSHSICSQQCARPGLRIEEVFKRVRVAVMADSDGLQIPWDNSSLTGDFYFIPPDSALPTATPAGESPSADLEPEPASRRRKPAPTDAAEDPVAASENAISSPAPAATTENKSRPPRSRPVPRLRPRPRSTPRPMKPSLPCTEREPMRREAATSSLLPRRSAKPRRVVTRRRHMKWPCS